jgi:multicomponent Na+:H+ antiporter subunit A
MVIIGFLAFKQTDIKALLAYSTISQLGYIVTMYGYSTIAHPGIGVVAATYHIVNHAAFKASLFLVAGIVAHEAATRDLRELGGLFKSMPITGIFAVIAGLAMAGLPPFNGFISKEMFYESALETGHLLGGVNTYLFPLMALLGGVATFAYSIKFIHGIFFGKKKVEHAHEGPVVMLLPAGFLAALCIIIGLFPNIAARYIVEPVSKGILLQGVEVHAALWHGLTPSLYMTIATIAIGSLVYTRYDAIGAWQVRVAKAIPSFSVDYWYDKIVFGARDKTASWSVKLQTGNIVTYMVALLLLMVFLSLMPIFLLGVDTLLPATLNLDVPAYEDLTLLFMVVIAVASAVLKRYVPAILALSGLGYLVVMVFIILNAPDLALTQVLVETLTTIIFFLVLVKVDQDFFEKTPISRKIRDLLISGVVTISVALLLINATGNGILPPFETLSYYFFEKTLPLGGGHNIVNVIIVDFRGYDTLGEITVLALAALGVINLILSRVKGGEDK